MIAYYVIVMEVGSFRNEVNNSFESSLIVIGIGMRKDLSL